MDWKNIVIVFLFLLLVTSIGFLLYFALKPKSIAPAVPAAPPPPPPPPPPATVSSQGTAQTNLLNGNGLPPPPPPPPPAPVSSQGATQSNPLNGNGLPPAPPPPPPAPPSSQPTAAKLAAKAQFDRALEQYAYTESDADAQKLNEAQKIYENTL